MSATNATANYELPIFLATDKPAWLTDWNGAMNAIDTAIHTAQATADGAQTTASTATTDIATINSSLSTITANITSLTTAVNGNTGSINTINSLIGNGLPTTDDKTIIGAINEIYAMITGGGSSEIQASNVSYDNTTSGLTADDVQEALDEIVTMIPSGGTIEADDVSYDNTSSGISATNVQGAIDEVIGLIPSASDVTVVTMEMPATIPTDTWTEVGSLPTGYNHNNCVIAGVMYYASGQTRWIGNGGELKINHGMTDSDKIEVLSSSVPAWLPGADARYVLVKIPA